LEEDVRTPDQVVGERLRTLRNSRRLSQSDLAERVRALGVKIQYNGVGSRERGATALSPSELFAFAYALDTSPLDLLVPADDDERGVAVTPEVTVEKSGNLRRWIRGDIPLRGQDSMRYYYGGSLPSLEEASMFYNANQAHQRLVTKADDVRAALVRGDRAGASEHLRELETVMRDVYTSTEHLVDRLGDFDEIGDES
jgi:transcriptional regulator with XRE-family HTH domain